MAANSNLLISITAKDQASGTFRRIKVSLGELEKESSGAGEAVGDLGKIFQSGLGKLAGGLAGAFAVGQIASTTIELAKLGAQTERTKTAYGDLAASAGQSGAAMLAAMRTATAGTVADSELMLAANRAMMLGVSDNAEEMSKLMAAAIERGRALGVSSQQAVNDIITGIGRMSPLILDNLGITGAAAAFDTYAASLGKTADQLTDVEKKQALVNAVLSSSSGLAVANDAAAAFERMDASIQNAKEAMGILFGPAVAAIADKLAQAATITAEALTENPLIQAEATIAGRVQALLKEAQDAAMWSAAPGAPVGPEGLGTSQLSDQAQRLQLVLFAIQQIDQAQKDGIGSAGEWADQITRIAERAIQFGEVSDESLRTAAILLGNIATTTADEKLQRTAQAMGSLSDATRPTAEMIAATNAALQDLATSSGASAEMIAQVTAAAQGQLASIAQGVAAAQGEQAGLDWLEMMNRLLAEQIEKWAAEGRTIAQITGVLLPNYISALRKVADGAGDAAQAMTNMAKGAQTAGTVGARMMAGLAIRIGAVTRTAQTASAALAQMAGVSSALNAAQGRGLGAGFRTADYVPVEKTTNAVLEFESALSDALNTAAYGGGGSGISGIGDEFDDLRSKVQGVISEAMGADIGGLNPSDFLPREDAVNENARRLAAIMRDGLGDQEWMEEFKAEVPALFEELANSDDPRAAAARMLQQFQAGLRPELLDKGMIKERVKAMILGDQSSAALAQEIAQELSAELGVSLAQAQQAVSSAMGGGALGGALPEGVAPGPDGSEQGVTFVSSWVKTVTGMVGDFDASGKSAGNAFGSGFMSVQSTFITQWAEALVALVTAGVVQRMASDASRTGAR